MLQIRKVIPYFIFSVSVGMLIMFMLYLNMIHFTVSPLINIFPHITNTIMNQNATRLNLTNEMTISSEVNQQYIIELSRRYKLRGVECSRMFTGDQNYTQEVIKIVPMFNESVRDETYINLTKDCERYRQRRGYITSSLTEKEKQFPIAFSMLVFKNAEMVERLLRAIFRPQNYYCIHVDLKSSETFFMAISSIAKCFNNVFLSLNRTKVKWGQFSVLEPELFCMEELLRYRSWKYFINLTGQEFPLRTNFELVKILKAYKGANNIRGTIKKANKNRWKDKPPPFGLRPIKGSVHITANREFVDFILHNETATALLNWSKTIGVPDEAFFSTLNYNPQLALRGTYRGEPDNMNDFVTRYKIWYGNKRVCSGRSMKSVCIQSSGDLYRLGQAKHLFANKFYLEEDRVAIGCLEEKLFNDTRDEYLGTKTFNDSYYANLDFVINQLS